MTQSADHPELAWLEALSSDGDPAYTVGRPDGKPLWSIIHDMEAHEDTDCAEGTAQYFHTGAGGRSVSSHYCWDSTSGVQCVRLKDSAWTVGNRPGNNRGINHELCGFASQSRSGWLDPFGLAMFERIVPVMRSDCAKYGIPLERRTVAELQAWRPGITSHNDLRLAFGGTTHTDPGSNFPWDVFMDMLTSEDDMTPDQARMLANEDRQLTADLNDQDTVTQINGSQSFPNHLRNRVVVIEDKVDQILAILQAGIPVGGLVQHVHDISAPVSGSITGTSGGAQEV